MDLHQKEENWFIAQCLEVGVVSQGHMIDEATGRARGRHPAVRRNETRHVGVVLRQADLTTDEFLQLLG